MTDWRRKTLSGESVPRDEGEKTEEEEEEENNKASTEVTALPSRGRTKHRTLRSTFAYM